MMKWWNIKQIMFHTRPPGETQEVPAGEGVKAGKRKGLRRAGAGGETSLKSRIGGKFRRMRAAENGLQISVSVR